MEEHKRLETEYALESSFKPAISKISILAIVYAIAVFLPAMTYLYLMVGPMATIPAAWFTLLLFIEIGKTTNLRITMQEATLILLVTGVELFIPIGLIYRAWYRTSSIAQLFNIAQFVPDWVAPAPSFRILELRTFIHPAWIVPIAIMVLSGWIIWGLMNFGLGIIGREMFIEKERLLFPLQQMDGGAVMVLTSKERRPLQTLAIFASAGFGYGFLLYALPFINQAYTGTYQQFIPIPFVDLNIQIERFLHGACLGFATDLSTVATGFVLPFSTTLGILIGSLAVWFFGNWITVTRGFVDINPDIPGAQSWWVPGMSIPLSWQRSLLYFWAPIIVGIGIAVGVAPMLRQPKVLRKVLSSFWKSTATEGRFTEPISFSKITLPMLIAGIVGGVALFLILVPDFIQQNLWFIPVIILVPILGTIISGYMLGLTGVGSWSGGGTYVTGAFSAPSTSLQNIIYWASGYPGVGVWFVPNIMVYDGSDQLKWFKVAELTKTRAKDLIKMYWFFLPLAVLAGLGYLEIFWRIAPIPSAKYPATEIFWPIDATMQSLWIKGREYPAFFKTDWILYAFIVGVGLYMALDFLHSPISFIAIGVGFGYITPFALSTFIGGLIGLVLARIFGREWWNKNKNIAGAGLMVGEGIAITFAVAVAIIVNSIWVLPF